MPAEQDTTSDAIRRQLSLFDVVCIIVGIIIGSGIYGSTPRIAQNVDSPAWLLFAWTFGGLIALVGALCYAELTTTYAAAEGGDYVYLTKAFGRPVGFLFTWAEFWIVRPGNVGAVAYVFADYARELLPLGTQFDLGLYASGAIVLITFLNVLGVRVGKWTQNLLTALKVAGLLSIFAVAMFVVSPPQEVLPAAASRSGDFRLAIVFVMFAYGGWKDISYVAAEVRRPERNLVLGLVLGTAAVMAIYLLTNVAFLRGLGFEGFRSSNAVAADLLRKTALGEWGASAISVLICISCLGAMNGMILTGARIYYALGTDHRLYAWLGHWNTRVDAPVRSLVLQGGITLLFVALAGSVKSFERLVNLTGPPFWAFMVLVGVALFVLRYSDRSAKRTFHVPLYPLTPILFCLSSGYMVYSSFTFLFTFHRTDALIGLAVMGVGLVVSFIDFGRPRSSDGRLAKAGKPGNPPAS